MKINKTHFILWPLMFVAQWASLFAQDSELEVITGDKEKSYPISFIKGKGYPDSALLQKLNQFKPELPKVRFYFITSYDTLIYISTSSYDSMGLYNINGKVILPFEPQTIQSPDATAKGYIVYRKNNKFGLVRYNQIKVYSPEYDFILNDKQQGTIIGKLGNTFYNISEDGTKVQLNDFSFYDHLKSGKVNFADSTVNQFMYNVFNEEFSPQFPISNGSISLSSFLEYFETRYYTYGSFITDNAIYDQFPGSEITVSSLNFDCIDLKKQDSVITTLFKYLHTTTTQLTDISGNFYIATFDSYGNMIDKKEFAVTDDYNQSQNGVESSLCSINDTITAYIDFASDSSYNKYYKYHKYNLFKTDEGGKIYNYTSHRKFPITSVKKLNDTCLQGIYAIKKSAELFEIHKFVDLRDVQFMIAEIKADYGFIFEDKKWRKYFNEQAWYQEKTKNIDTFLSEIDRFNLSYLMLLEKKLKKNEVNYTKPISAYVD